MQVAGTVSKLHLKYSEDGATWLSYKESGYKTDQVDETVSTREIIISVRNTSLR